MNINILKEYKLKGERNNRPRQPVIWGDKIYLIFVYDKKGFVESRIQCLQLSSFELIWEYTHNHVINNILVASNNTIIAGCMNGIVLSLKPENGEEVWRFTTNESNTGPVSNEYEQKIVFSGIQSGNTSTWSLDIHHGNTIWKQSNNGHSYIPKIYDGHVYNCIGNDIYCLQLADGLQIWTGHEPATYLFNPKIYKQMVLASGHGVVDFYGLKTGEPKIRIETGVQSAIREVISDGDDIFFGDEKGFFYSYKVSDNAATLIWKIATEGGIQTIPLIMGNTLFILNDSAKLLIADKETGAIISEKKVKGAGNISGITLHEGRLYFSCGGGYLFECGLE